MSIFNWLKKEKPESPHSDVYDLFGNKARPQPLVLVAGPCVIESEEICAQIAGKLKALKDKYGWVIIFKASFDKANRTSAKSFRGLGLAKGLEILSNIRRQFSLPVLTDVHCTSQAEAVAAIADILQVPAFLCRQTDLLVEVAKTGVPVNIKKGQFMAPWDMQHSIAKIRESGNPLVMVTERGTMFGYNNLVVDMCSLPVLRDFQVPVLFDATHSVQKPGGRGDQSGGAPRFIEALAHAAAAVGIDGLFLEVHPEPEQALSDSSTSLALDRLESLMCGAVEIDGRKKNLSP